MTGASEVCMDQASASWNIFLLVLLIAGVVVGGGVLLVGCTYQGGGCTRRLKLAEQSFGLVPTSVSLSL